MELLEYVPNSKRLPYLFASQVGSIVSDPDVSSFGPPRPAFAGLGRDENAVAPGRNHSGPIAPSSTETGLEYN